MADDVTGKQKEYPKHEAGQFAAVCCDIIDLGQKVVQYQGNPPYIADKFVIAFKTDAEGEVNVIYKEYTNSLSPKGNLLKDLTSWRGRSYTAEELAEGIQFKKMVGHPALLAVEHQASESTGRVYANLISVTKMPKGMTAPDKAGYERPEFWSEKKAAYKMEADKWVAAQMKHKKKVDVGSDDEMPTALDDSDDSLPFLLSRYTATS